MYIFYATLVTPVEMDTAQNDSYFWRKCIYEIANERARAPMGTLLVKSRKFKFKSLPRQPHFKPFYI